jgi:hypothetical protein
LQKIGELLYLDARQPVVQLAVGFNNKGVRFTFSITDGEPNPFPVSFRAMAIAYRANCSSKPDV